MNDRELNQSVRLPKKDREALREYADEHELTYTEAILDIIPENETLDRGESSWIQIRPEAYDRLYTSTGEGVDYAEVIRHYLNEAKDE